MTISVLISCMHQTDFSIVERSNIQTDCVVINQCDIEKYEDFRFINNHGRECLVKFISTKERGLSRSRNMAIKFATSDICLICDDDEVLKDDYEDIILREYESNPKANVIIFEILRKDKLPIGNKRMKMGFKKILQTSSVQITFRREDIVKYNIKFDTLLGSGSGNGAGEENKFLLDCKKKSLNLYYTPVVIGKLMPSESNWFSGYNEEYFINDGWSNRRILGGIMSILYIIYFVFKHKAKYSISPFKALKLEFIGWNQKR